MQTHRENYLTLKPEWESAHKAARAVRAECTEAFAACAAGNGAGATDAQMIRAQELEAKADALRAAMDAEVQKALGWG